MFSLGFFSRPRKNAKIVNRIKTVTQNDRLNQRRAEIRVWIQCEINHAVDKFLASNGLSGKADLLRLIKAYVTLNGMNDRQLKKFCKTLDSYVDSLNSSQLENLTSVKLLAIAL